MAVATWWHGDSLPQLPPLPGFDAALTDNVPLAARLAQLNEQEVQTRMDGGHRLYVASLREIPISYGWVATRNASIGKLGITFQLPTKNLYLWDFATLPTWRGYGVYPQLLQVILKQEASSGDRFWIIYAPENHASERGIHKAGMSPVAELSFAVKGGAGLVPFAEIARAQTWADVVNIPLLPAQQSDMLAPCWSCGVNGKNAFCWSSDHRSSCTCV
jgi:GNAT superfamily N-acetyltransferase